MHDIRGTRIRIRYECDPFPTAHDQPRFVKEAWGGLELIATKFLPPGESPVASTHLRNGAYMVPIDEIRAALRKRNSKAGEWYAQGSSVIADIGVSINLPIPTDCCDVIT